MNEVVSVEWLRINLNSPDLIVLDASLKTTADGSILNPHLETIPEARNFDLKNTFSWPYSTIVKLPKLGHFWSVLYEFFYLYPLKLL